MKVFTSPNQKVGQRGEILAVRFLVKHKHAIVSRNISYLRGEIDIVSKKGNVLYFVEVKCTRCFTWNPLENMSIMKIQSFKRAVELYRKQFHVEHMEYELWCMAVYLRDDARYARIISVKL